MVGPGVAFLEVSHRFVALSAQECARRAESDREHLVRETAVNARIKQLRDLVVALDRADRNIEAMAPDAYQAAARTALVLTNEEMGLLPIADFAGPISALQSMAENIFFAINGCFADLDGTGRAPAALTATSALLERLCTTSVGASQEIGERLFTRLRAAPPGLIPGTAVARPPTRRPRAAAVRSRSDRIKR